MAAEQAFIIKMFSSISKCLIFSSSCQKVERIFFFFFFGGHGGIPGHKTYDRVFVSQNWCHKHLVLLLVHAQPPALHQNPHSRGATHFWFQQLLFQMSCLQLDSGYLYVSHNFIVLLFPSTLILWWVQEKLSVFSAPFFLLKGQEWWLPSSLHDRTPEVHN